MELNDFTQIEGKELPAGKNPVFRKVDTEASSAAKKSARDKKFEAYSIAKGLDVDALNRAAILLGKYNSQVSELAIRETIEAFAEENPDTFIAVVIKDAHGDAKAAMKMAIHLGIIEVSNNELKWAGSQGQAIMAISSNSDAAIQFANYIVGDPQGTQIYGVIKDQISKKNKEIAKKVKK
jgi:hypothetical protein